MKYLTANCSVLPHTTDESTEASRGREDIHNQQTQHSNRRTHLYVSTLQQPSTERACILQKPETQNPKRNGLVASSLIINLVLVLVLMIKAPPPASLVTHDTGIMSCSSSQIPIQPPSFPPFHPSSQCFVQPSQCIRLPASQCFHLPPRSPPTDHPTNRGRKKETIKNNKIVTKKWKMKKEPRKRPSHEYDMLCVVCVAHEIPPPADPKPKPQKTAKRKETTKSPSTAVSASD